MPTPSIEARVTPAMLHILLALASEEMHGYGIMQAIDARTGGAVEIGPGTLYRTIAHLGKVGWIEEASQRSSGNKRTYRLTASGRDAAVREVQRLARLVSWAEQSDLLEGAG